MRRRDMLTAAAVTTGASLVARSAFAQGKPNTLRLGVIFPDVRGKNAVFNALEGRLRELGYIEGQNFTLDALSLQGRYDGYAGAMKALVAHRPDVLLAWGPEAALKTAMAATTEIPIVMVAIEYDPLTLGYVKSLARPGSNVTGVFLQQIELAVKRLQFLKEALPDCEAVTVLWDELSADQWQAVQKAAPSMGLRLSGLEFTARPYDYDRAFATAPAAHRSVVSVSMSATFWADRTRLAELALRSRSASMFPTREFADAGGLLSYGPSFANMVRRAADYVDRIARGAKPAELPIEQPSRFELVINLKTAKALGLTIPPLLLARADEVVE